LTVLVFDSGVGGLGVVEEIRRAAPGLGLDYLMDDGFFPYGEKPDDVLIGRILAVVSAGVRACRPDVVVVACNTASTIALGALRAVLDVPFVGCVPPVKPAAAASVSRHIGLLATAATIRRPYLQDLVARFGGGCEVHALGTAVLADLAEGKFRGRAVDMKVLEAAVAPMFEAGEQKIDAVALGCTHYTFLREELAVLRGDVRWFDPAGAVARQAIRVAGEVGDSGKAGRFCSTGDRVVEGVLREKVMGMGFGGVERLVDFGVGVD
jgi:glutamate racemase